MSDEGSARRTRGTRSRMTLEIYDVGADGRTSPTSDRREIVCDRDPVAASPPVLVWPECVCGRCGGEHA